MKKEDRKQHRKLHFRHTLRWRLTLFIFGIMLCASIIAFSLLILAFSLFEKAPWVVALTLNPYFFAFVLLALSAIFGMLLSGWLGKYHLRPLKKLIHATNVVKTGDFSIRVEQEHVAHSEMDSLIKSFNEMVQELDGIELFRNDFINHFSHEFKTPIVSIRGFARELQQDGISDDQRKEYLRIIEEESDRLSKLSIHVLELCRLENQQFLTDKRVFSLDEQMRRCILALESGWETKHIDMIPELMSVSFYSNESLLALVWNNLLDNAIKFTPENGIVTVRLTQDEDHVTVQISDTGIGMGEEEQQHIFEKFYQGERSHNKSGYGIGLATVKNIVRLCKGSIEVESSQGNGSTFTVILPKEQPEDLIAEPVILT